MSVLGTLPLGCQLGLLDLVGLYSGSILDDEHKAKLTRQPRLHG